MKCMWEIRILGSEGLRDLNLGLKRPQYACLYKHYEGVKLKAPRDLHKQGAMAMRGGFTLIYL